MGDGGTAHRVPAVSGERVLPTKKVNVKCQNASIFRRNPLPCVIFTLFLALISLVSASEKPNVLFIFADDMTYEAIGFSRHDRGDDS